MADNIYKSQASGRMANTELQRRKATSRIIREGVEEIDKNRSDYIHYFEQTQGAQGKEAAKLIAGLKSLTAARVPTDQETSKAIAEYQSLIPSMAKEVFGTDYASVRAIMSATASRFNETKKLDSEVMDVYEHSFMPVVGDLLRAVNVPTALPTRQSGEQLLKNVIIQDTKLQYSFNYNSMVRANMQRQKANVEHIHKTGKFMEFDLEGIGKDITEFAFVEFDKNNVKNPVGEYTLGLSGVSEESAVKLRNLIEEYRDNGFKLKGEFGVDNDKRYMLEAIAKRGHKKTVVERRDGINILKSYATDEDVRKIKMEDLERGLQGLMDDYKVIHNAGLQKYKIGGRQYNLYADDAAILKMFHKAKTQDITMVGLNVLGYDNAQLNYRFTHAGGDARLLWKTITGNTGDMNDGLRIIDETAILREKNDPEQLLRNANHFAEDIVNNPGNTINTSRGIQARFGNEIDPVTGQIINGPAKYQDMMQRIIKDVTYAQHGAFSDTATQGFAFMDMLKTALNPYVEDENGKKIANPEYMFRPENMDDMKMARAGDIFRIQKGQFGQTSLGGLSFVVDGISGDIRVEGARFDSTGKQLTNQELVSPASKGNVYAMLAGIKEISVDDELAKRYAKIKDVAGTNKLVAMYFYQYGQDYLGDAAGKFKDLNVWVGTRTEAEEFLGANPYVGSVDPSKTKGNNVDWLALSNGTEEVSRTRVAEKVKETYDRVDEHGAPVDFNEQVKISNITKQRDSASRWLRDMDYSKAKLAVNYIKDVDVAKQMTSRNITGDISAYAAEYLSSFDTKEALLKRFNGFNQHTGRKILTQTIGNLTNSAGYIWSVRDILQESLDLTDKLMPGNNKVAKNEQFSLIFRNALAVLAEETGKVNNTFYTPAQAYGQMEEGILRTGKQHRSVRIDLTDLVKSEGFADLNSAGGKFIEIDPYEREPHWAAKLSRMLNPGVDNPDRATAIRKLGAYLSRQYSWAEPLKHLGEDLKDMPGEQSQLMNKVNEALTKFRKRYPTHSQTNENKFIDTEHGPVSVAAYRNLSEAERSKIWQKMFDQAGIPKVEANAHDSNKIAQKITDALFSSTQRFNLRSDGTIDPQALSELTAKGFSSWEAEEIIRDHNRRYSATKKFVRSALQPLIGNKYSHIGYYFDPDSLKFGLIDKTSGEELFDFSNLLPKEMYDERTGRFSTQFGGAQIATIKTFGRDRSDRFGLLSQIEVATAKLRDYSGWIEKADLSAEERINAMKGAMKRAIDVVRPKGETRFDHQDIRYGLMADLNPLIKEFGYFYNQGKFESLTLKDKTVQALKGMAGRLKDKAEKHNIRAVSEVKVDELEAIYKDFDTIFGALAGDTDLSRAVFAGLRESELAYVQSRIKHMTVEGVKAPGHGLASFTNSMYSALSFAGKDNRSTTQMAARSREIDLKSFYDQNPEEYRDIVRGGRTILTQTEAAGARDTGYVKSIRTRGLNMDTMVYESAIAAQIEDELNGRTEEKLLTSLGKPGNYENIIRFLNENGSIVDPRLQHLMPKNINQKINTNALADIDELMTIATDEAIETEKRIRRATEEVVNLAIEADGNVKGVTFKYKADGARGWDYIGKDEAAAWNKSYRNTISRVAVDREGFLYKRYIRNGQEVSEDEINKVLEKNKDAFVGVVSGNGKEEKVTSLYNAAIRQQAAKILEREGYSLKYVIKSPEAMGYQKFMDNAEKSMGDFITMNLGGHNAAIRELINPDNKKLADIRPSDEALKDLEHLNVFLTRHGYNEITESELKKKGFTGFKEGEKSLKRAILDEQATYYDAIVKTLHRQGVVKDWYDPHVISTAMREQAKESHREGEVIEARIADAIDAKAQELLEERGAGKLSDVYEDATKYFFDQFDAEGVFRDKKGNVLKLGKAGSNLLDGGVIGNDLYQVNVQKIDEIVGKVLGTKDTGYKNAITAAQVSEEMRENIAKNIESLAEAQLAKHKKHYTENKISKEAYNNWEKEYQEKLQKAQAIREGSKKEILAYQKMVGLSAVSDADEVGLNNGSNNKGVKMTRRLMQNLNQEVVDERGLELVRESYEKMVKSASSPKAAQDIVDRFNRRYGDFGVSAVWDSKTQTLQADFGKAGEMRRVNADILKNMEEEIIRGQGFGAVWGGDIDTKNGIRGTIIDGKIHADDLKELEGHGISKKTLDTMIKSYEDAYGTKIIGMENLLNHYSYAASAAANEFNIQMAETETEAERQAILNKFMKDNPDFAPGGDTQPKHIANIHLDDQFNQNDPLNPRGRNMVIDLGEGAKQRYVAVPFENLSVMDAANGEGVIAKSDIRDSLSSVQHYYNAMSEKGEVSEARKQEAFDEAVQELLSNTQKLTWHKEGAAAQATSAYITGSGTFKADIIRMTDDHTFEVLNRTAAGFVKGTDKSGITTLMNSATVDGMSLAEHIKAGHNINATFLGREYFENAIQDKSMNNILEALGAKKGANIVDGFLDKINEGGGLGLQLRQPPEYNTSVAGSYLFYDKSLARNQARVAQRALAGQNGDKDGDLVYALLARSDAEISITGKNANGELVTLKSFNTRINQLQARALEQMDLSQLGINTQGLTDVSVNVKQDKKVFDAYARSAETIGTASLSGIDYDVSMLDKLEDDIRIRNEEAEIMVGGSARHYGQLDIDERNNLNKVFDEEIKGSKEFQQAIEEYNKDKKLTGDKAVTVDSYSAHDLATNTDHVGIADRYLNIKYGEKRDEFDSATKEAFEGEANVLAARVGQQNLSEELASRMGKERAGIFNMNTYRMTQVMHILRDAKMDNGLTTEDVNIVNQFMAHVKEAGQAPKNASASADDLAGFDDALNDFLGIGKGRNGTTYAKQSDSTKLFNLIDSLYEGGIKEFKKLPDYAVNPETGKIDVDAVKRAFSHIKASDMSFSGGLYKALRLGYAEGMEYTNIGTPDEGDMLFRANKVRNDFVDDIDWSDAKSRPVDPLIKSPGIGNAESMDTPYTPDEIIPDFAGEEPNAGGQFKSVMESAKKSLKGKGAMAMLGFAGAMMTIGMAGGAPTAPTPTQGQAKGIQQENAMYEIPSTMSMQGVQSGANQSYIINVNASTEQGRDFATAAINQAFSQMPQSAGGNSMTMNIKDSSSNIGYRDIASYVSDML